MWRILEVIVCRMLEVTNTPADEIKAVRLERPGLLEQDSNITHQGRAQHFPIIHRVFTLVSLLSYRG